MICSLVRTLPELTTFPSMANAGVSITPISTILSISVTFSIVASMEVAAIASLALFSSLLHLEHPVPKIWIFAMFPLLETITFVSTVLIDKVSISCNISI